VGFELGVVGLEFGIVGRELDRVQAQTLLVQIGSGALGSCIFESRIEEALEVVAVLVQTLPHLLPPVGRLIPIRPSVGHFRSG
jgi:hypothetical protein